MPVLQRLHHQVADRARPVAVFLAQRREQATSLRHRAAQPFQVAFEQPLQPWHAARLAHRRPDHDLAEALNGQVQHCLLQHLLGLEVRIQAALRHIGVRGQRGQRQLFEADLGSGVQCLFDDGVAGELSFLHGVENSTTGRFVNETRCMVFAPTCALVSGRP
ncbi:hypothetical protein D3C72_1660690 [compost metagenome]